MSVSKILHCTITFCILLAMTTVAWGQTSVQTWRGVTVTDAHGWQLENVTITWIEDGRFLEIRRTDGATRTMAPEDVQLIHDAQGVDITAAVGLARTPGAGGFIEPAAADNSRASGAVLNSTESSGATTLSTAGLFNVGLDVGMGYATHAGTWFSGLDDGLNFQVGARAMVTEVDYMRFIYRRQDFGDQSIDVYVDPVTISVDLEISLREYQLLIGRNAAVMQGTQVKSVGYLEYGISVMEHIFAAPSLSNSSDSITKTGMVLQGGVLVLLDKNLAFDISASVTWKSGFGENDEGNGLLMGAHLGLALLV